MIDNPSPDKDDEAVRAAWRDALSHAPAVGISFQPRRAPGSVVASCQVAGVALIEATLEGAYLYHDHADSLLHACPKSYWDTLIAGDGPLPEERAAAAAVAEILRSGPAAGARFRHYKGDTYKILAPAVIDALNPAAGLVYQSEAHMTFWVRTLGNFFDQVRLPDGRTVPRFDPVRP